MELSSINALKPLPSFTLCKPMVPIKGLLTQGLNSHHSREGKKRIHQKKREKGPHTYKLREIVANERYSLVDS